MTTDRRDDRADVIEAAKDAMSGVTVDIGYTDDAGDDAWASGTIDTDGLRDLALSIQRAGLLATPADQDELVRLRADYTALVNSQLLIRHGELGTRLVRAEAENAELRVLITDAGLETYTPDGSERVAAHLTEQQRIITGLRATVDRVRALHILSPEEVHCWECDEEYPCPTICALDGAGEQR